MYVQGSTNVGMDESSRTFSINNPGNAVPEIEILSPEEGDMLNGEWPVKWFAEDADGDELRCSMYYSSDNGGTWQSLFIDITGLNEYVWSTQLFANSPYYRLALSCFDDSVEVRDTTEIFEVFNERAAVIPAQRFYQAQGHGDAVLRANVVDPERLVGDLYCIAFDDSTFEYKVYDVLNMNTGEKVVEQAKELDGVTEGPLFEGMRLLIEDREQAEIDYEHTGWTMGSSTLEIHVYLPIISIGSEELKGCPYPADYTIGIFNDAVDTSASAFGALPVPMMFAVHNVTEGKEVDVVFSDMDNNHTLSRFDELFILEEEDDEFLLTWAIFIGGQSDAVGPRPGDVFTIRTLKPLRSQDVFLFKATLKPTELARIEVTPSHVTLLLEEHQQFIATGYGTDGLSLFPPITPIWSVDGGTITSGGLYRATAAGDFIVTAAVTNSMVEGTATVHVLSCAVIGDANGDGIVDVADVLLTVNYIIGIYPDPFHVPCADCNGDGQINVLDVVGIVNIILGAGTW